MTAACTALTRTGPDSVPDHRCPVLIPAYRPGETLLVLVAELRKVYAGAIIIVDDGSGPAYQEIFDSLGLLPAVAILSHTMNRGKGAALNTGMNYVIAHCPGASGVVTADADGQHHPEDILQVRRGFLESRDCMVLGARAFEGAIPARSRFGNSVTRVAMKLLLGRNLRDTQTGLRAIPAWLLPALTEIRSPGYEFELEMLVAAKHLNTPIVEMPIRTIYEPGNRSSHFNPLLDSMRIYFVLLRFSMISLATSAIDNAVFIVVFRLSGKLLLSQICGRALAVVFNYSFVRKAVFHSDQKHALVLPRYLMLVLVSGSMSWGGIVLLASRFHVPVIAAKVLAETVLFFVNFAAQRDIVFTRRARRCGIDAASLQPLESSLTTNAAHLP